MGTFNGNLFESKCDKDVLGLYLLRLYAYQRYRSQSVNTYKY